MIFQAGSKMLHRDNIQIFRLPVLVALVAALVITVTLSCSRTAPDAAKDGKAVDEAVRATDAWPSHARPLYLMTPAEIDRYLKDLRANVPSPTARLNHIMLQYVGQGHRQGIIGDFPFDLGPDDLPLFNVEESDCVSFVESTFAMALADSWRSYFVMLQRIRYRDGRVSWETRNHFIEADWQVSNGWMIRDVNRELGADLLVQYAFEVERDKFFRRNGRKNPFPPQRVRLSYFPADEMEKIIPRLKSGMLFNMIRTNHTGKKWVGHLGFIHVDEEGEAFIVHSGIPTVRKIPFREYLETQMKDRDKRIREQKPYFEGFRFFEIRKDALERLRKIDGPRAPRLVITGK